MPLTDEQRQLIIEQQDKLTPENRAKAIRLGILPAPPAAPMASPIAAPSPPAAPPPAAKPPTPTVARSVSPSLSSGMDVTKIQGPRSFLEQLGRGQQYGRTLEYEATKEHPEVAQLGNEIAVTSLLSLIPGGQPVAAARYARLAPLARKAYWVAKEMLAPLTRAGVIGIGTAGVPLLYGKPMSEAVQTAFFTAIGNLGGRATSEEGRQQFMGTLRQMVRESPEGTIARETLTDLGHPSTLGQTAQRPFFRNLEATLRERVGGGRLNTVREEGEAALVDELRRVEHRLSPQAIAGNPDVLVKESITAARGRLDDLAAKRYGGIDLMIANRQGKPFTIGAVQPTDRVSLAPAKAEATRLLAEMKVTGVPTNEGQQLLTTMLSHPRQDLSFAEAQQLRSNWLKVSRQTEGLMPGQAHEFAQKLSRELDDAMATTARSNGADVYEAWRATNDWYKGAIKTFDNPRVEQVLRAGADSVWSVLAKKGSPIAIRTAREAVDNPILWGRVGQEWLSKAMGQATQGVAQTMNGTALFKTFQDFGREALTELFPGGHGEDLYRLARSLAQLQRHATPSALMRHGLTFTPAGALALGLGFEGAHRWTAGQAEEEGRLPAERGSWPFYLAGTILISPLVLNRVMSSPRLTRAFLDAATVTGDARRRAEIAGSVVGLLAEHGLLQSATPSQQLPSVTVGATP